MQQRFFLNGHYWLFLTGIHLLPGGLRSLRGNDTKNLWMPGLHRIGHPMSYSSYSSSSLFCVIFIKSLSVTFGVLWSHSRRWNFLGSNVVKTMHMKSKHERILCQQKSYIIYSCCMLECHGEWRLLKIMYFFCFGSYDTDALFGTYIFGIRNHLTLTNHKSVSHCHWW